MSDQDAPRGVTDDRPVDATGGTERSGADRIFAGRYRLLGRQGRATDIALFEAVDALTDRSVALKIVHPDICSQPGFEGRFLATMHDTVRARHPNLTEVLDVGTSTWGGRTVHFVVCENLTGGSVRDLRDRGRQLSPSQVVMVGLDACRGLDVAHREGLVHGDIRPANLVFGDDGRLRLTDLGLARLVTEGAWSDPGGVDIERAKYASPEQAQGRPAGPKSDVYALCLCLLEIVTGQLPFIGDSAVATLANRIDKLMTVSADLGPLAAVLERAGRPDPADRSSASEFGRALHQAAEKLPRPAPLALVGGGLFATATPAPDVVGPSVLLAVAPVAAAPTEAGSPVVPSGAAIPAAAAPAVFDVVDETPELAVALESDAGDVPDGHDQLSDQHDQSGAIDRSETTGPVDVAAPSLIIAVSDPVGAASEAPAAFGGAGSQASGSPGVRAVPIIDRTDGAARSPGAAPMEAVATPPAPPPPASSSSAGPVVPPPPLPEPAAPLLREPRSRRKLLALLAVLAVAVALGGALAFWFARDTANDVPDLTGLDQGAALNMISEFDWDVTVVPEPSDEVEVGNVVRTDPAAGARLDVGDALALVVSTGPAPRPLPDLTGLSVEAATTALADLDLVLEVGEQPFSEDVEVGQIISWIVPDQPGLSAGDTVLPDTTVVVVVSAGPAARVVPDLAGVSLDAARATVEGLGLVFVALPDEFNPMVPAGGVALQEPVAGTEVERGATVSIAVSLGPDLVGVPPLADLGVDAARAALEAAGLVLGEVAGDPAGVNVLAEVDGVSIGADATFPRGTAIDLTFEVPAPPPTDAPVDPAVPAP